MSNEKSKFTKDEKAKIALEAVSGGKDELKKLASKHGVSEEDIMDWAKELGVVTSEEKAKKTPDSDDSFKTEDQVDLEVANQEFSDSVNFGASIDNLNIKKLTFWTIFGTFLILVMIVGIIEIYDFTISTSQQDVAKESTFYDISELRERDKETLNSYGVVDLDEGIYRIPIDSAISLTAKSIE
jgi:transposase-like protein